MRTPAPPPDPLLVIAAAQEGLLSADQCDRFGVNSGRRQRLVRARIWRPVTRGVVDTVPVTPHRRTVTDVPVGAVPPLSRWPVDDGGTRSARAVQSACRSLSPTDVVHEHRRRRAAWAGMLAFGPQAVAVGSNALALHGVEGLPVELVPQVALPKASDRRHRRGLLLRQFDDGMTCVPFGDPRTGERHVASVEWALAQAVPELPMMCGLAVLDSALRLEAVDRAGLARAHDHARGRRGVAPRHELWDVIDPRAESPLESFARWQCIAEGVPPHDLQVPVHSSSGRRVGVVDMAWWLDDGRMVAAELDGFVWHEGAQRSDRRDRDRDNDFAETGVLLLRFDARHIRQDLVGRRVRAALRRTNTGLGSY